MVDIMDMEDIITNTLKVFIERKETCEQLAKNIIKEVEDFVDYQQTIKCANCKGLKFKKLKDPWQVM